METRDNCNKYGSKLYTYITETIMDNVDIIQRRSECAHVASGDTELFSQVIEKFITLSASHYVKLIKEEVEVKKKFEHRKQVKT